MCTIYIKRQLTLWFYLNIFPELSKQQTMVLALVLRPPLLWDAVYLPRSNLRD